MRRTLKRDILAPAALLLALVCSGARAYGQSDGFFGAGGGSRGDDPNATGGASWTTGLDPGGVGNYGTWTGFGAGGVGNGGAWYGFDDDGGTGNGASWSYFNEEELPVGSGLLVLAASGACYAAFRSRRKRDGAAD